MTLRLPTTLATDSDAAAGTALTKCYGDPYLGEDAYVGAHFDAWSSTPGNMFEPKEPNTMNHEPMTQERREAFWRKYRWTPDLRRSGARRPSRSGRTRRSRKPRPSASERSASIRSPHTAGLTPSEPTFASRGLSSPTLYELPSSEADLYRLGMIAVTRMVL